MVLSISACCPGSGTAKQAQINVILSPSLTMKLVLFYKSKNMIVMFTDYFKWALCKSVCLHDF